MEPMKSSTFNTWADEISPRLPKFTSEILEERITMVSPPLPVNEQSDNLLSLTTARFSCGLYYRHPIHGTDVPSNRQCLILPSDPPGKPIGEATLDLHTIGTGLVPRISQVYIFGSRFNYYSRIEILILDCGEDPESITLAEINSKLHWFVFYENGELAAHNWAEIVSPSLLGVH